MNNVLEIEHSRISVDMYLDESSFCLAYDKLDTSQRKHTKCIRKVIIELI